MNRGIVITLCLAAALMASSTAIGQTDSSALPRDFSGNVLDQKGAVPGRSSARLQIHIDSYTSDEEVRQLVELLARDGSRALAERLRKMDNGWLRIGTQLGYPIASARIFATESGLVLRVFTDRPIAMFEVMRGLRSEDYPFGLIELKLDASGKGEGSLIAAAALEIKNGQLELESYGTQPFRIVQARVVGQKRKK